MQKIYINKITDRVEQILKEGEGEFFGEDYFSSCYMVEDKEENINSYNLRYNKEENTFEIIEGLPPKDEVIIIPKAENEEIKQLKNENEELKARLDKLEELIKKSIEVR